MEIKAFVSPNWKEKAHLSVDFASIITAISIFPVRLSLPAPAAVQAVNSSHTIPQIIAEKIFTL